MGFGISKYFNKIIMVLQHEKSYKHVYILVLLWYKFTTIGTNDKRCLQTRT